MTHTWRSGDRFRYAANPVTDGLEYVIDRGATGTLDNAYPYSGTPSWWVTFDATKSGRRRESWYVSENAIEPLTEWSIGDRFVYTGNPADDSLGAAIATGATGIIAAEYVRRPWDPATFPKRWHVTFDAIGTGVQFYVTEANLSKPATGGVVNGGIAVVGETGPETAVKATLREDGVDIVTLNVGDSVTFKGGYSVPHVYNGAQARIERIEGSTLVLDFGRGRGVYRANGWRCPVQGISADPALTAVNRREAAERQLAELKEKVALLALGFRRDRGWCSEVNDCLDEMDIEYPTETTVDVVLRVTIPVVKVGNPTDITREDVAKALGTAPLPPLADAIESFTV